MKHLFTLALMGCMFLIGCNNDENLPNEFSILGEWELAEVHPQWPGQEDWIPNPDYYQFNQDNTFSRTRVYDAEVTQYGNGTYVIEPPNDDDVNVLF